MLGIRVLSDAGGVIVEEKSGKDGSVRMTTLSGFPSWFRKRKV